jgi:hypothetical protein
MKGDSMSREDVLDRLRSLDPDLRFHDEDDEEYDAQVVMHRVLARQQLTKRRLRILSVPRVVTIAVAALAVVLVLPALAVGTSPFHLLGGDPEAAPPVNGLLVAKGSDGLFLVDPKSGGMLRVKDSAAMDHPAWSPDGRYLAVEVVDHGSSSVYTMWPNGAHTQLIMKNATAPAWSDDGSRIYVQRDTCTTPGGCDASADDATVVYSVAIDGSNAHQISDDDYDPNQPGWPPGQNILAFLGDGSSNGPSIQAGPSEVNSSQATWSPDGTELAVADAPTGLWVINVDGKPQLLAKGAFSALSWGVQVTPAAARSAQR